MDVQATISALPLVIHVVIFAGSSAAIAFLGVQLAGVADRLADRTGLGEAVTGAIFLGASTSLSGIVTSFTAAFDGYAQLAVSNALGGITVQTTFLAIADITYRKANLEHAAASAANMMQGTVLVTLLSIPLLAMAGPEVSVWGFHPASPILLVAYMYGMRLVSRTHLRPMWAPHLTPETKEDQPHEERGGKAMIMLIIRFAILAALLGTSGWVVARTGIALSKSTGLSETAVGGLFTAVSTSLPELVTTLAAVRIGALTLAVGDIIGGNAFDTLFLAVSDFAYRQGSIYHAVSTRQVFLTAFAILMTGILLMGLIHREKRGIANIGFESTLILALYVCQTLYVFFSGNP